MSDRLLRLAEVARMLCLSRASIYRQLAAGGEFPKPLKVGPRAVRWSERELEAWLASRPRGSGQAADAR